MTAQARWKEEYIDFRVYKKGVIARECRNTMINIRREAALERKLSAAERTIQAQAERIEALECELDSKFDNPFLLSGDELDKAERQLRSR